MPVERPQTFTKANIGETGDDASFKEKLSSFVVAYGLALQGLAIGKSIPGGGVVKSNLLPPEIVKQVVWRKKKPYFAVAAACLALSAGTIWFRRIKDMNTLTSGAVGQVSAMNFSQATQLLRRGGPTNMLPRQEAMTWIEVAKAFQKEMGKYRHKGSAEQEKATAIVTLQRNKAVWPRILTAIHSALPVPQEELAAARTPREYVQAIKNDTTGKLERGKRNQVFIEEFSSTYVDDLDAIDLLDVERGDAGVDVIKPVPGEARRGFLITLRCRTPNRGRLKFVDDGIKTSLRQYGRKPGTGFYINRVVLTAGRGFTEKDTKQQPPDRGRGRHRRSKKKRSRTQAQYDPLTDESMETDWVFELKFDVVLGDLPKEDKAGGSKGA